MSGWDARCQSPIPISHEAEGGLGPSPIDVPDGSDLHGEATMAADSAAAAEGVDTAVTGSQPPAFCQCPSNAIGPLGARVGADEAPRQPEIFCASRLSWL